MKQMTAILILGTLILQTYAAPQFITFKDGKLGVNFMGYHAGVGIGGLAGDSGSAGRLFAEAGTPTGQLARAGLGGQVDDRGRASGGLFAGATAGGNVRAAAGLAGGVNENNSQGGGFAGAQAGHHIATSGLGGESAAEGASGFKYSNDKVLLKEKHNVIKPLEATANFQANVNSGVENNEQPAVLVKEVYVEHKRHHKKPHKTYVTYVDESEVPVSKSLQSIEKRIDAGVEGSVNIGAKADAAAGANAGHVYTKTIERNPDFFENIFNIPISTLASVRNFLSNTAENTNVSIQKSASVNAETDLPSAKDHSFIKSSQSSGHVSVETPSASKFLDDIFAIPINTLGAVGQFLDNNVPARKTVQTDGEVRLRGPARRRAAKRIIITNQQHTEGDEQ
ncbi:uncharacterized protein LOC121733610 [Aricia agestis]|uniref:uncharacterized protein LOC121733610 n=1 Tax=Aricia agestis TaxID=91739 RepID=UPI001C20A51E|nr:uncharacterized protein LOC121733610 [Aricia agestis]XP_041979842.1 uncharacterized protein LOC121733610 [Aricia agestis]